MQHKVIFFGTPEIAQAVLKTLLTVQDIKVIAAVCQPDRPSNRNKVVFSPVKELCLAKNIPLFQPTKLSEIKQQLLDLSPDLIITCAYGLLVPPSILAIPKYKCVNVHPSLLPKYRGPAPINYVIFNQEKTTGVTLMYMDKDMDTGDIIVQSSPIPLATGETYSSLYEKLTKVSCDLILKHISSFFTPNLPTTTQNHALATYSQLIDKNITKINWNEPAALIVAKIRGLYNKPLAFCEYQGLHIKIHEALEIVDTQKHTPGVIISITHTGIIVATSKNSVAIKTLQLPNKNPVHVENLINGNHPFKINTKFI